MEIFCAPRSTFANCDKARGAERVRGSNHLNPNIIESKRDKSEGLRMNERNIEPQLLTDLYKHLPISPSMFPINSAVRSYIKVYFSFVLTITCLSHPSSAVYLKLAI